MKQEYLRLSKSFGCKALAKTAVSVLVSSLLLAFLPGVAAPQDGGAKGAQTEKSVPVIVVDFAKLTRFRPTSRGVDWETQRRLLQERRRSSTRTNTPQTDSDGKPETDEARYRRRTPYPEVEYDFGGAPFFGLGTPEGSICGTRPRFTSTGDWSKDKERLWRWKVPAALQGARRMWSRSSVSPLNARFKSLLMRNAATDTLLLFDSTKGLVWKTEVTAPAKRKGAGSEIPNGATAVPYEIINTCSSSDGAFTLLILSDASRITDFGTRLLVFDHEGQLTSQTEMPGVVVLNLLQNNSGNSYLLLGYDNRENSKPSASKPEGGTILLRRDGTVAGVFSAEGGEKTSGSIVVSDDDAIAVAYNSGLVFTLR